MQRRPSQLVSPLESPLKTQKHPRRVVFPSASLQRRPKKRLSRVVSPLASLPRAPRRPSRAASLLENPLKAQKLPRRVAFRLASLQRRPRKHPSQAASLLASPLKKRMSPLQRQNLLKREICSASRRHLPREHRQIPSLLMSLCLHRPCCAVRAWRTL